MRRVEEFHTVDFEIYKDEEELVAVVSVDYTYRGVIIPATFDHDDESEHEIFIDEITVSNAIGVIAMYNTYLSDLITDHVHSYWTEKYIPSLRMTEDNQILSELQ